MPFLLIQLTSAPLVISFQQIFLFSLPMQCIKIVREFESSQFKFLVLSESINTTSSLPYLLAYIRGVKPSEFKIVRFASQSHINSNRSCLFSLTTRKSGEKSLKFKSSQIKSTLFSIKNSATSSFQCKIARYRGEIPSEFIIEQSTFSSTSTLIVSKFPFLAAKCAAVNPFLSTSSLGNLL